MKMCSVKAAQTIIKVQQWKKSGASPQFDVWKLKFLWSLVFGVWCFSSCCSFGQEALLGDAEEHIIRYESPEGLTDPVARLEKRLADGKAKLNFEPVRGYLPALLKALRVPVSSQALVFSKTSSQRDQTSPKTPRAVYFGDDISVAWVPGGPVIDLASVDPNRGPVFYTLDQKLDTRPKFTRRTDCLRCHFGPKTLNVPGLMVGSFYTASNGMPLAKVDGFVNGHNSPLSQRWGGWYVTGTHSGDVHLGNLFANDEEHPENMDLTTAISKSELTDLRGRFDTSNYLSPHSDIVALLVLEHQVRMQNLITRANYETRYALAEQEKKASSQGDENALTGWGKQRIAVAGEGLLEYMLFRDEAPLQGPVRGTSGFAEEFQRGGPRASKGRSLRQLDLHTRLSRYPCSFLIYSSAFDALPREMKEFLWQRLEQILTGKDRSATYATLTTREKQDVLEILRETKPEFAAWMKK
jgi:hypothetical protein